MACHTCYDAGPTTQVELRHNVGMLFMRQVHTTAGHLCRPCLHRAFTRHTLLNLTVGWWGTISFFMTWYYLFSNTTEYMRGLKDLKGTRRVDAPPPPRAARGPEADERLSPFRHNVRLRLQAGESAEDIAGDLATTHQVDLADARRFMESARRSQS